MSRKRNCKDHTQSNPLRIRRTQPVIFI